MVQQVLRVTELKFSVSDSTITALPHPRALAFLGDAVFELHVRQLAVSQGMSQSDDLHRFTTARVNAARQANLLALLHDHLSEPERDIVRQARNQAVGASRRHDQALYRQATGFEALVGALFLSNPARLQAVWQLLEPVLRLDAPSEGGSAGQA